MNSIFSKRGSDGDQLVGLRRSEPRDYRTALHTPRLLPGDSLAAVFCLYSGDGILANLSSLAARAVH